MASRWFEANMGACGVQAGRNTSWYRHISGGDMLERTLMGGERLRKPDKDSFHVLFFPDMVFSNPFSIRLFVKALHCFLTDSSCIIG
jgi:hypothetical protein